MKILLEELPHQERAMNAILNTFKGIDMSLIDLNYEYSNPFIKGRHLEENYIDVKMETGTGKTYVYTRMMYELHQKYGIFKFIIVVPSPAIKEGTKNFIESEYAKQHFSQFYENIRINLHVINNGDFLYKNGGKNKRGRRNFPPALVNFAESSKINKHTIEVLLINSQMLNSKNMKRDDYDQTLLSGFTSPVEALKQTQPVVIIDEPHKFPRNKAYYKAIESLEPQIIIRFGATFPEKGSGQNKREDFYRGTPQYYLNAIESFNEGLVKGVKVCYPEPSEEQIKNKYKVEKVTQTELVLKQENKTWNLEKGDNLAIVDESFEGNIIFVGGTDKKLSNELELGKGMVLLPGTFKKSYQELIIRDALEKHFEIEQKNFMRENDRANNNPKIKTLSLFFIDNIKSYREEDGWLKKAFERLLGEKLKNLILKYKNSILPREKEYYDFLLATQANLNQNNQNVHAGYFGEDRGSGDEAIQAEVEDILKNKEKLLSFKDKTNEWETRRFLFSKWTLREGWDNPNVFVIAKLRTSGSETSKIQEVGRGLRLPVDEYGYRVQQEEWKSRLNYLIGYDEKEFAQKLTNEINKECIINKEKLTRKMIEFIVKIKKKTNREFTEEKLLTHLDNLGIINRLNEFKENVEINGITKHGYEWLKNYYPEINSKKLHEGKIIDNSKENKNEIKLKKENWDKLKKLWDNFSQQFMLEFHRIPNKIEEITEKVFTNPENYERDISRQINQTLYSNENTGEIEINETSSEYSGNRLGMKYGKFLKEIAIRTALPIKIFHPLLVNMLKTLGSDEYLSEKTLNNLVKNFKKTFDEEYEQYYEYESLDFKASTSVFDPTTRSFKDYINANDIGTNSYENKEDIPRYLYELPPLRYDSHDPEEKLLRHEYNNSITVYGKLPKKAIQVPKYTGGTTTPDFVYLIEKENSTNIYLLVETKAENMRVNDEKILKIQRKFFETMRKNGIEVEYKEASTADEVYTKLREIINTT